MCGLPFVTVSNVPGILDPFGENMNRKIDEERKKQQKPARKWDHFIHNDNSPKSHSNKPPVEEKSV